MIIRRVFPLFAACFLLLQPLFPQTNKSIKALQERKNVVGQAIKAKEIKLGATQKDVRNQLTSLTNLGKQIVKQQTVVQQIQEEVGTLSQTIGMYEKQIDTLQTQLNKKKKEFSRSLLYIHRNKSLQNKLMFIFSADNFSQLMRRLRYVQAYASYQRAEGEQIRKREIEVRDRRNQLLQVKNEKDILLEKGKREANKLQNQQEERQKIVSALQKQQRNLQNALANDRKTYSSLNSQIDRFIQAEIASEKRRKAEAEDRAKRERETANRKKAQTTASKPNTERAETAKKPDKITTTTGADHALSAHFEANRGKLPAPLTGAYRITSRYGQYHVQGLTNIQLDNKGINLTGSAGLKARTIFNGEVSAVFSFGGFINVLVRHGSYISVYCNLSAASVRQGQRVNTRDVLGTVAADGAGGYTLHFQLRKETAKLNPEVWLSL